MLWMHTALNNCPELWHYLLCAGSVFSGSTASPAGGWHQVAEQQAHAHGYLSQQLVYLDEDGISKGWTECKNNWFSQVFMQY